MLHEGRPDSPEGREEKEIQVYQLLDRIGISYSRIDHEAAMTMEACKEIDRALGCTICKNLFLCNRQQSAFYLLMMPGDKPFKTRDLSAQIGSARLSFAPEEKMEEYLNIRPGAVSVMGLMNDTGNHVQLLVDADILEGEYVGYHPCVNTSSLKIRVEDILGRFLQAVRHEYRVVKL